jgi:hypothetical protein
VTQTVTSTSTSTTTPITLIILTPTSTPVTPTATLTSQVGGAVQQQPVAQVGTSSLPKAGHGPRPNAANAVLFGGIFLAVAGGSTFFIARRSGV